MGFIKEVSGCGPIGIVIQVFNCVFKRYFQTAPIFVLLKVAKRELSLSGTLTSLHYN